MREGGGVVGGGGGGGGVCSTTFSAYKRIHFHATIQKDHLVYSTDNKTKHATT